MERILVAVSGTEASIVAAQYAICLAKMLQSELIAVFVVDIGTLQDLLTARIFVQSESLEYERDLEEDGRRYLNYVSKLGSEKGVAIRTEMARGQVHTEVLNAARTNEVNLIVLGEITPMLSRLETQLGQSERILYDAPCPVLVVKDEETVVEMYESL
ncbi:MAG TPA: universal stress protein [bacterium]|nr:universal stress protein [bacterium]